MKLFYRENGYELLLGEVMTNHSISVDEAMELLGIDSIDMDEIAREQGWDDWSYDALEMEY